MVRRYRTQLVSEPNDTGYGCAFCSTHLCLASDVLSRTFHGKHGKAFLVNRCENYYVGPQEQKELITGTHIVRDVFCTFCDKNIGWCYDFALDEQERYKVHRFVLENKLVRAINSSPRYGYLGIKPPQQDSHRLLIVSE
ncbi:unnamed protein product [Phytomonas sp. EM1]|nr:unnamed protein product [Phytomonas sp. EM1]|eukprot:CCW61505.1 unnamed protein product [Phytomonas sp. isolate EM1]